MLIEIKQIEPQHARRLSRRSGRGCPGTAISGVPGGPADRGAARVFVENNLARGYPHLIALWDDQVVGWCDITPMDRPIYAHLRCSGDGAAAGFPRPAAGNAAIRAALAEARRIGLHRVELTVRETNASAISLYKAMEFKIEGVKRDGVQIDGRYRKPADDGCFVLSVTGK